MQNTNINDKLIKHDVLVISEAQLAKIKRNSNLIVEENTLISDYIRIFQFQDTFIFQEKTPKGEIIIRKFTNKVVANNLLQNRLDTYEKMWNGCGCKIDYYS